MTFVLSAMISRLQHDNLGRWSLKGCSNCYSYLVRASFQAPPTNVIVYRSPKLRMRIFLARCEISKVQSKTLQMYKDALQLPKYTRESQNQYLKEKINEKPK